MYSLMDSLAEVQRRESYNAWSQYQLVTAIAERCIAVRGTLAGGVVVSGEADCVIRVARQLSLTRRQAEILIDEAIGLQESLPEVLDTLRDGITTRWQVQVILSRTALVAADSSITPTLDAEIAATLRSKKGSWTRARLRDMVDGLVFRHDPDLVRERRKEALDNRGMWTNTLDDGTAEITGVMAAENVHIAAKAVRVLADSVCQHDGRTAGQRNSDAMFALLSGAPFECSCDRDDCTAEIPEPGTVVAAVRSEVIIHAVTDPATLDGAAGIGWIDGYGVISDEHVRDLASRPDATITPVTPVRTAPTRVVAEKPTSPNDDDPDTTATKHERSRPDRPSSGDTPTPAATASTEIVVVYPGSQYRIRGDAETLEDLFPNLRRIRFEQAAQAPPTPRVITGDDAPSPTDRTAAKHARRRAERARNQRERERRQRADGPAPF